MDKNISKIKYISVADSKIYKVTDIDFGNLIIKANETDLSIEDVSKTELWDISEFKDFRVALKNKGVGKIVEFVKK